jgi:hypothetical protein
MLRFIKSVFVFLVRANVKITLYLNPTPRERKTGVALIPTNYVIFLRFYPQEIMAYTLVRWLDVP